MNQIGGPAGVGAVHMAGTEPQIVRHAVWAQPRRVAGTEIAVDILKAQPCVFQRPARTFGMQLRNGLIRSFAGRVLEGTCNAGLASNAHQDLELLFILWALRLREASLTTMRPVYIIGSTKYKGRP
ncbi:hypothetical protein BRAS3843_3350019 [Bradyrhizobium sp. STM 3843]|nr:hypothetical protein BRAS3843_3350019 [Bradyrhizobium sp. STM 3843]